MNSLILDCDSVAVSTVEYQRFVTCVRVGLAAVAGMSGTVQAVNVVVGVTEAMAVVSAELAPTQPPLSVDYGSTEDCGCIGSSSTGENDWYRRCSLRFILGRKYIIFLGEKSKFPHTNHKKPSVSSHTLAPTTIM